MRGGRLTNEFVAYVGAGDSHGIDGKNHYTGSEPGGDPLDEPESDVDGMTSPRTCPPPLDSILHESSPASPRTSHRLKPRYRQNLPRCSSTRRESSTGPNSPDVDARR